MEKKGVSSTWQDRLTVDVEAKLEEVTCQGTLPETISEAGKWFAGLVVEAPGLMTAPLGISSAKRTPGAVRKQLDVYHDEKVEGQLCIFSGTLGMLDLTKRTSQLPDASRIRYNVKQIQTFGHMATMVGTLVIDGESIPTTEWSGLTRLLSDAEVDAALLTMYWHREQEAALATLVEVSKNLVFSAQSVGASKVAAAVERFRFAMQEESKRVVVGRSARQVCVALQELVMYAREEHPEDSNKLGDADIAERALTKYSELGKAYNKETCKRYLAMGCRLQHPTVKRVMELWEFRCGRGALLDSFTNLRAAVAATRTDEELVSLVETLFYEQVWHAVADVTTWFPCCCLTQRTTISRPSCWCSSVAACGRPFKFRMVPCCCAPVGQAASSCA